MTATTTEVPSITGKRVNVVIVAATRADVLDAAIEWRTRYWAYSATIDEPEEAATGWYCTGSRWSSL